MPVSPGTIIHETSRDVVVALFHEHDSSHDGEWLDCSRFESLSLDLTVSGEGTLLVWVSNEPTPATSGIQFGIPLAFNQPIGRFFGPNPAGAVLPRWFRLSMIDVSDAVVTALCHCRKK
jgi:hypothetical protein